MSTPPTEVTGATPDAARRPRRPWWLWLLLALVVLALLVFGLVRCGSGGAEDAGGAGTTGGPTGSEATGTADPDAGGADAGAPTGAAPAPGAPASGAPAPGAPGSGTAGSLTAGGTALLPVAAAAGPGGELTGLVDEPVSGQGVVVQSVPADEGFWVGGSDSDRVWVQLAVQPGESPFRVQPGDRLDLTGRVVAHDAGFAQQVGVDAAEGAEQLTRQAAHVEVAKADLRPAAG